MSSSLEVPRVCSGCGADARPGHYSGLVCLEGATGQRLAYVCEGRRAQPKQVCLQKLLAKRSVSCVICGDEGLYHSGRDLRPVCKACEATVASLRKETDLKWYAISVYEAFGNVDVTGSGHLPYVEVARGLRKILCGDAPHGSVPGAESLIAKPYDGFNGGDIWARLTQTQADGVLELVAAFKAHAAKVSEDAKEAGGALLVQLARGEVSIEDFEDGRKPALPRKKR